MIVRNLPEQTKPRPDPRRKQSNRYARLGALLGVFTPYHPLPWTKHLLFSFFIDSFGKTTCFDWRSAEDARMVNWERAGVDTFSPSVRRGDSAVISISSDLVMHIS